ncbi:UNVERIFIED_CONTAM: hypothetical protein FKN15_078036 [Acipenser sinensis]
MCGRWTLQTSGCLTLFGTPAGLSSLSGTRQAAPPSLALGQTAPPSLTSGTSHSSHFSFFGQVAALFTLKGAAGHGVSNLPTGEAPTLVLEAGEEGVWAAIPQHREGEGVCLWQLRGRCLEHLQAEPFFS